MFERFTERARQVVVLAQQEARNNRVRYIGPEHILVGIAREEEGLAARVLASMDVTTDRLAKIVRDSSEGMLSEKEEYEPGQVPFTPRAKKVLQLALREALSLGHNYIGTEHVLLGLLSERATGHLESNKAVGVLVKDFRLDPEKIRSEVIRMLSGPASPALRQRDQVKAARERRVEELAVALEELKKTQELRDLVGLGVKLARMLPDIPEGQIVTAAIELHG